MSTQGIVKANRGRWDSKGRSEARLLRHINSDESSLSIPGIGVSIVAF